MTSNLTYEQLNDYADGIGGGFSSAAATGGGNNQADYRRGGYRRPSAIDANQQHTARRTHHQNDNHQFDEDNDAGGDTGQLPGDDTIDEVSTSNNSRKAPASSAPLRVSSAPSAGANDSSVPNRYIPLITSRSELIAFLVKLVLAIVVAVIVIKFVVKSGTAVEKPAPKSWWRSAGSTTTKQTMSVLSSIREWLLQSPSSSASSTTFAGLQQFDDSTANLPCAKLARLSGLQELFDDPSNARVVTKMKHDLEVAEFRLRELERRIRDLEQFERHLKQDNVQNPTALGKWKLHNFENSLHLLKRDYDELRQDREIILKYWFNAIPKSFLESTAATQCGAYRLFVQRLGAVYRLHISISELEDMAAELATHQNHDTTEFDFASLLSGAMVFSTDGTYNLCQKSLADDITARMNGRWTGDFPLDFAMALKEVDATGRPHVFDYANRCPELALLPGRRPGQCWAFQEFPGKMYVAFPVPIHITGFTIEHLNYSLMDLGNLGPAPKAFSVFGITDWDGHNMVLIGRFTYNAYGASKQKFMLAEPTRQQFHSVYFQVTSSHRSTNGIGGFTCVYRFRVHGEALMRT